MRTRGIPGALALLVALALACAGPPSGQEAEPVAEEDAYPRAQLRACIGDVEVQRYLAELRERAIESWELPAGVAPDQRVRVLFSLRADGYLRGTIVADALTQEIEDSAVRALEAASPFPPLEGPTACLVGMVLAAEFQNPGR